MPRGQVESSRVKSSQVERTCVYACMFPQAQHVLSHGRTNRPAWYANIEIAGNRARVFRVAGENSTTRRRTRLQTAGLIRTVHVRSIM